MRSNKSPFGPPPGPGAPWPLARTVEPSRTPAGLKLAAVGFVLIAVGLFVIPHDVPPRELFAEAFDTSAEQHRQTLYGLLIIIAGAVGAALGIALGGSRKKEE